VLVGDWAHTIISGDIKHIDENFNIQIISENDIEHDFNIIAEYLAEHTHYGIYYKKKNIYIPKDRRIFKYVFFIKYPSLSKKIVDKQFLDIYNCGSYELTPYTNIKYDTATIKIGTIYVQMRFLMIDLWILYLLKYLKEIDDMKYNAKHDNIFSTLGKMRKKIATGKELDVNYFGINYDEKIYQKIMISEKNIKKRG
jgi:hypothetical protein